VAKLYVLKSPYQKLSCTHTRLIWLNFNKHSNLMTATRSLSRQRLHRRIPAPLLPQFLITTFASSIPLFRPSAIEAKETLADKSNNILCAFENYSYSNGSCGES
jgi:hypothetical protein